MSEILNILGSVGFNWHVALANFVNFLIILFLLNVFFFKKLGKTIDNRNTLIEEGVTKAQEAELTLRKAEEEKKEIIHAARKESKAVIEQADIEGKQLVATLQAEAQDQIDRKLEELSQKEKTLEQKVEKEFGEKAPELIARMFSKTLEREMTEEENNKLILSMK